MQLPTQLRPARLQEAGNLSELALRSKAYWGYPPDFIRACRKELTIDPGDIHAPGSRYVVADQSGSPVGFYALEKRNAGTIELIALFVEPDMIGTGLGKLLINDAKTYAAQSGAVRMIIQGDPNATAFYHAAGGRQVGERESGSIPGRMLPLFEISLSERLDN